MDKYSIETFIGSQVEIRDFGGLPESDENGHVVVIYEAEKKGSSKSERSGLLKLMVRIVGGPNSGRTGIITVNLWNENEKARQIAAEQFSKLTYCLNMEDTPISDVRHLFNKPFRVFVRHQILTEEQKAKGLTKNPYTEIYDFADVNGVQRWKGDSSQQSQPAQGGWGGNQPAPAQQAPVQQAPAQSQPAQGGWGGNQQAPVQQAPAQSQPAPWGQGSSQPAQPAQPAPAQSQQATVPWGQAPAQSQPAPWKS